MTAKQRKRRAEAVTRWKARNPSKVKAYGVLYHKKTYKPHPIKKLSEEQLKYNKYLQDKRYRELNYSRIKAQKKEYYIKNYKKIRERGYTMLKNNINYKISASLRNRVGTAAKNGFKNGSAVKDLGCSIEFFKSYISQMFVSGMSWNNYGKWHLDHIIPLCRFNLSDREQFLKAAHFSNYQPLWAVDNLRKNKYDQCSEPKEREI